MTNSKHIYFVYKIIRRRYWS